MVDRAHALLRIERLEIGHRAAAHHHAAHLIAALRGLGCTAGLRVASLRKASRSARWRASFMPGNVIVFPGMKCCGSLIHSSSVSSVQMMPADLSAGE